MAKMALVREGRLEKIPAAGGPHLRTPLTSQGDLHSSSLSPCISLSPRIQFHPRIWLPWWRGISNYVEKARENHPVQGFCSNWVKFNYRKCGEQWARGVQLSQDWKGATGGRGDRVAVGQGPGAWAAVGRPRRRLVLWAWALDGISILAHLPYRVTLGKWFHLSVP